MGNLAADCSWHSDPDPAGSRKSQVADYVLHDFSQDEAPMLERLIAHVVEACEKLRVEELIEVKSKYSLKSIEGVMA